MLRACPWLWSSLTSPCALTALATLAVGCNAVLGIERLEPSASADAAVSTEFPSTMDPESAGAGRAGGRGGSELSDQGPDGPKPGGGGAAGHATPSAGRDAQPSAGGHNVGQTDGGVGAQAGSPSRAGTDAAVGGTMAAGAAGDTPMPQLSAVRGRVIDFWRHGIGGASVRVGAQTTRTDERGEWSLDAVTEVYDVTVSIATTINNLATQLAWQVQGLTRRDPTIQVERAAPDQSAPILINIDGPTFPLGMTQRLITAWASPDGTFTYEPSTRPAAETSVHWEGPTTSAGTAHALLFEVSGEPALPMAYHAHHSFPVALRAGADAVPIQFGLMAQQLDAASISGTIVGPNQNRDMRVTLRFADDTALAIVSDYRASDSFSYIVPKLPSSALTLSVENNANGRGQGMAATFVDNVAPGAAPVTLSLPPLATLVAPADAKTNVDGSTQFEWNGDAKVFLLCAESTFNYDRVCVLTSGKAAQLPIAPVSDVTLGAGTNFTWYVETHDAYASVDEAVHPAGYLSAYTWGSIRGPKRGDGSYTRSAQRGFQTPP